MESRFRGDPRLLSQPCTHRLHSRAPDPPAPRVSPRRALPPWPRQGPTPHSSPALGAQESVPHRNHKASQPQMPSPSQLCGLGGGGRKAGPLVRLVGGRSRTPRLIHCPAEASKSLATPAWPPALTLPNWVDLGGQRLAGQHVPATTSGGSSPAPARCPVAFLWVPHAPKRSWLPGPRSCPVRTARGSHHTRAAAPCSGSMGTFNLGFKPQCFSQQVTLGQTGRQPRSTAKFLVSKCFCLTNFRKGEQ